MSNGTDHGGLNRGHGFGFCPIDPGDLARQELGIELLLEADARDIDTSRVSDLVPVRVGARAFGNSKVSIWGKFPSDSGPDFELNIACSRKRIERLGIEIPGLS